MKQQLAAAALRAPTPEGIERLLRSVTHDLRGACWLLGGSLGCEDEGRKAISLRAQRKLLRLSALTSLLAGASVGELDVAPRRVNARALLTRACEETAALSGRPVPPVDAAALGTDDDPAQLTVTVDEELVTFCLSELLFSMGSGAAPPRLQRVPPFVQLELEPLRAVDQSDGHWVHARDLRAAFALSLLADTCRAQGGGLALTGDVLRVRFLVDSADAARP